MAAAATDMFTKVGTPGTATTLSAPGHAIAGTSITVVSTVNWPTTTGVIFAIDTTSLISGVETRDVGSYTEWEGVVASGTSITGLVLRSGTDQIYPAGATTRVYIPVAGSQNDRMVTGLVVSHNQDGTMITNLPLTSPLLTTPRITTSINDTNGNEVIITPATASAVNEVTITNAATGGNPSISASGSDATANLNLRGKGLAKTVTIGAGATTIFPYDYVVSGCVWTADSVGVNLNASGTSGVVVINGNPLTVLAVSARAFTTNVDTYIDVLDNGDGTGLYVYPTAATNAASAALAANSIRIGIIQAAATITATTKVNQGQEDKVFPVVAAGAYSVTDSLGNLICPRDPHRKLLGYAQRITPSAAFTTVADIGLVYVNFIALTTRKIKISMYSNLVNNTANTATQLTVYESGSAICTRTLQHGVANASSDFYTDWITTVSAGLHSYTLRGIAPIGGTSTTGGSASNPTYLKVELI